MIGEIFDPRADLPVYEHRRPHWSQAGAIVFITFRTHDSIPRAVVEQWEREKQAWLRRRGHDTGDHWSDSVPTLPDRERAAFHRAFNRCRETYLDACHGGCWFRRPDLAGVVADALLHFDGERYRMGDFVVMPNHVHLLAAFPSAGGMKDQCDSWLHYSAVRINRALGKTGKFWQQEPFDHLVRSPGQYEALRQYVADNPRKAGLKPGEYYYRRYPGIGAWLVAFRSAKGRG